MPGWTRGTAAAALVLLACSASGGGSAPPVPATGFFTRSQVERGRRAFDSVCRACHELGDFRGATFEWAWRRRTAWDFFGRMVETMPEDNPGILEDATYADLVAYILALNGYATGAAELAATEAAMSAIPLGPGAGRTP